MIATHVSIAPRAPSFLAGRGGAARIGHESHDPIEANLLLLPCADERAIAIVALDALFGSLELRQVILDALGDARPRLAELVLVASHSHSTPTLDPVKPGLGRCQLDHLSAVGTDIAQSIRQLLQASGVPSRQPEAVGSLWHGPGGLQPERGAAAARTSHLDAFPVHHLRHRTAAQPAGRNPARHRPVAVP